MYAARRDHIERLIAPALKRGAVVVCDRFADSTRAYQGAAGGVPRKLIDDVEVSVLGEETPDLTLILDLPARAGLARSVQRGAHESRFESKGLAFHERLRDFFLELASREPLRCILIDAARDPDAVAAEIWLAVEARLAE